MECCRGSRELLEPMAQTSVGGRKKLFTALRVGEPFCSMKAEASGSVLDKYYPEGLSGHMGSGSMHGLLHANVWAQPFQFLWPDALHLQQFVDAVKALIAAIFDDSFCDHLPNARKAHQLGFGG